MTEDEKIKYINRFYSITNFFPNWKYRGNVKCPFHSDRSPSARLFVKENNHNNENILQCFTCGKLFYVIHFIRKFNLNLDEIFDKTYSIYGEQKIEYEVKKEKPIIDKTNLNILEYTKKYFSC